MPGNCLQLVTKEKRWGFILAWTFPYNLILKKIFYEAAWMHQHIQFNISTAFYTDNIIQLYNCKFTSVGNKWRMLIQTYCQGHPNLQFSQLEKNPMHFWESKWYICLFFFFIFLRLNIRNEFVRTHLQKLLWKNFPITNRECGWSYKYLKQCNCMVW